MKQQSGSIWQLLLIVFAVVLAVFYGVQFLNTGNALWFLPFQPEYEPRRVVLRGNGDVVRFEPGDPEFDQIATALNAALSDFDNSSLVPIGISQQTVEDYTDNGLVMEILYPQPIQFNTPVRMRNINQLLIPIEGRHAGSRYVFLGNNGLWLAGAMVMTDETPLMDTLRVLGFGGE